MATMNKIDMLNCAAGHHDFSDDADECHVCGCKESEASWPAGNAAPNDSALRAKLQEAVDEWPQFDVTTDAPPSLNSMYEEDSSVNGGDLVEWFGIWRAQVKELLRA